MRRLLSFVMIGFLAFACVSFAKHSDGLVLFRGFGYQVELSLAVFIVAQLVLIYFLYLGLKILSFIWSSKRRFLAYLKLRQERHEILRLKGFIKNLVTSETQSLYKETQKYIRDSDEVSRETLLVAARAAHVERHYSDRDASIARLELADDDDVYLAKSLMLIDEARYHDALAALSQINKRSTSSVRSEVAALRLGEKWDQVLLVLKDAKKFDAFSSERVDQIELEAFLGILSKPDMSLSALKEILKQANKRIRGEASFVMAMSKGFLSFDENRLAQNLVEDYLSRSWDDEIMLHYVRSSDNQNVTPLEKAEKWLEKQPRNPRLLTGLVILCRERELWGKSESYFRASNALENSVEVAYELSILYRRMNRLEESKVQLELFAARQVAKVDS